MREFSLPARNRRICFSTGESESKKNSTQVVSETESPPESLSLIESSSTLENGSGYKYLEHPSDIGIYAWGKNLEQAFIQAGYGLFGCMTDLSKVDPKICRYITVTHKESDSFKSLDTFLFKYLNELLYIYGSEYFVASSIEMIYFHTSVCELKVKLLGETFSYLKHSQGTEIKAITYHAIKVKSSTLENPLAEVQFLVDI